MSRITYNHLNLPHTISGTGGTISNVYDAAGRKWQSTQAGVTTTYFGDIEYEGNTIKAIYHQDGERTRSSHTKWLVGEVKRNVRTAVKRGAAMESKHFARQPKCFCGRILNNNGSYEYQYYIKDHLGNVRIVCNTAAVIQSEQHYYPFGLKIWKATSLLPATIRSTATMASSCMVGLGGMIMGRDSMITR